MSDAAKPRLKISRPGLMLIKSFEGFRPRAVQAEDGRWIVGYGHTASTREGAVVDEADAELLLQYDLLPITAALNDRIDGPINQHQFDALASFAISVGLKAFLASDVLRRFNAGQAKEAADALIGWPEPESPDAAPRRRSAERALFNAGPDASVTVADLMIAPLPVAGDLSEEPAPLPATAETAKPQVASPDATSPASDARAAAVASLLGERAPVTSTPVTATDVTPAPAPATDDVAADPAPQWDAASTAAPTTDTTSDQTPAVVEDETPAAPVMRHEATPAKPKSFDWGYTGAFMIMGAIGFTACGAAAAAFRLASSRPSPSNETLVIAGVLGLIGAVCVAAAAWNLYVRWSKPD
ncbi:MAG: hypothetical protein DCF29_21400 [Alphaproteobacteria bacterium]|nr:MAG: hypothetical protein DCF29_21400 [Alphaproteobacteria bacterium]